MEHPSSSRSWPRRAEEDPPLVPVDDPRTKQQTRGRSSGAIRRKVTRARLPLHATTPHAATPPVDECRVGPTIKHLFTHVERDNAVWCKGFLVPEDAILRRWSTAEYHVCDSLVPRPLEHLELQEIVGAHWECLCSGAAKERIGVVCRAKCNLNGDWNSVSAGNKQDGTALEFIKQVLEECLGHVVGA